MTKFSFLIRSLGCKVSQYDGERLAEKLGKFGLVANAKNPDIFILNGCSVTGRASQKVRQTLRAARKRWPHAKIVLAGCEARLRDLRHEESPEADYVLPYYDDFTAILEMLQKLLPKFICYNHGVTNSLPLTSRTRAFLKVQDGCNQFCSYCIVPHLRGKEWSRPIDDAVAEAIKLVEEGHKELVLTGIHLGHFRPSLLDLLIALEKIPGLQRLRLSSIEPIEVDDALINWVASSPKACPHFHLPLQSGSDTILQAMRRPYTTADFRQVVEKIRAQMPLAAITTDLIVGFPGETDELFAQTMTFLEEMQFSRLHIFKFSPRDGTPAASMPNQVNNAIKMQRSNQVEQLWKNCAQNFHRRFIGRIVEVLWESCSDGFLHGFSREYIPCRMPSADISRLNQIMLVNAVDLAKDELLVSQLLSPYRNN